MKNALKPIHTYPWVRLWALWGDRRGAIAVLFALMLVPLLGFVGLAVDGVLLYSVQSKLQDALDAAALAGARVLRDPGRDARISDYFNANYPEGYLRTTELNLNIEDGDAGNGRLVLSAEATVPTTFSRVLGFDEVTVSARTGVLREPRGMELALVIDTTGSMDNLAGGGDERTRMQAVRDTAAELVDHLYGSDETVNNLWISLVPFTTTVNIGSERTDWLTSYDPGDYLPPEAWDRGKEYVPLDAVRFEGKPYEAIRTSTGAPPDISGAEWQLLPRVRWKGCVLVREGDYDQTDDPPSVQAFTNQFWPSTAGDGLPGGLGNNDWTWSNIDETSGAKKQGLGPNLTCGEAIMPLTAEKTTVQTAIREMQTWARGGTMANLGLLWGWRTLSPRWRGLWGGSTPSDMPLDYSLPHIDKVIVLLTDGENSWNEWQSPWYFDEVQGRQRRSLQPDYTAYGDFSEDMLGVTTPAEASGELDDRTSDLCGSIKSQGITLFTITTGTNDPLLQDLYRKCASSSEHYSNVTSAAGLRTAFQGIERELANLRITH